MPHHFTYTPLALDQILADVNQPHATQYMHWSYIRKQQAWNWATANKLQIHLSVYHKTSSCYCLVKCLGKLREY